MSKGTSGWTGAGLTNDQTREVARRAVLARTEAEARARSKLLGALRAVAHFEALLRRHNQDPTDIAEERFEMLETGLQYIKRARLIKAIRKGNIA